METSPEINELAKALAAAQAKIQPALRDKRNPDFNSMYADLASVWDACREPLSSNGLSVVQFPVSDGPRVGVTTTLMHASGQWMRSTLWLTPEKTGPQALVSCVTYGRRTALSAAVGVAPAYEDDDGNAAEPAERYVPRAPESRKAKADSGAADLTHDGHTLSVEQLAGIHTMRAKAGGKWCTSEDDARTGWRQVLQVYRDASGARITAASQLSRAQGSHLMDRILTYIEKTAANVHPINLDDVGANLTQLHADELAAYRATVGPSPPSADPNDLADLEAAAFTVWGPGFIQPFAAWLRETFGHDTVLSLTKAEVTKGIEMLEGKPREAGA